MGSSEREAGRGLSLATSDSMVKQRLGAGWNMLRQGAGARGSRLPASAPRCLRRPLARGEDRRELGTGGVGVGWGRKGRKKGKERKKERRGKGEGAAAPRSRRLSPNAPNLERGEKSFQKNLQAWIGVFFFFGVMAWGGWGE